MTRMFGHDIRSDVLLLCMAEIAAVFIAVYSIMALGIVNASNVDHVKAGMIAAALAVGSALVAGSSGLYQPSAVSRFDRVIVGAAVATLLLTVISWLSLGTTIFAEDGGSPWSELGTLLLGCVLGVLVTRICFTVAFRSGLLTRRIIVVGAAGPALSQAETEAPFEIAVLSTQESFAEPARLLPRQLRAQRVWALVAANHEPVPGKVRQDCAEAGVRVLSQDDLHACRFNRLVVENLPEGWLSETRSLRSGRFGNALHRSFDILLALLLLIATAPVMAIAALLVSLDSPGPILYRQKRVGRNGKLFDICKFRSMVVDAEVGGVARWATTQDPRVTRFGRFMRLTRIDELPQVFNVLRGDMAFVGPRPERPVFVDQLGETIANYRYRDCVKPGITGWAQVNYPYGASVEDARMKLAYDLYYVQRRSLFLDLLILVATIRVVLFQEGAR